MVLYLLKSSFCLALLLAVYHLFLEKEKMHQFNRFYLLGSILFSFLAPTFIIYTEAPEVVEQIVPVFQESPMQLLNNDLAQTKIQEASVNYKNYVFIVYISIATLLFFRFTKNVYAFIHKIKSNTKTTYKNATLVLLTEKLIPHTFLSYIFINKSEFKSNTLEKEIFEHELAHVREKHTLDIFIVELFQIVCWFNPLIMYLKRAIKLNHEFIADNKVIQSYNNTIEYQHLLLSKVSQNQHSYLASNFNYLLTKKRLKMMTTTSSKTKILLKKLAVIPLLAGAVFLFAERVEAKEKDVTTDTISEQPHNVKKALDILEAELPNKEDKVPSETTIFLASVERTENSILLKCYDCYRWADLKLELNTEYIINDFGFSEGKTIQSDKYAFTIKATKNQVIFKGLKNTAWKDLSFTLNKDTKQFFNHLGMVSNENIAQEKVTPKMIAEYNALAKKYNSNSDAIIKKKELQRLKYIYSLMTEKQKKSAEKFPNIPPPPPVKVVKGKKLLPPPPPANAAQKQLERPKNTIRILINEKGELLVNNKASLKSNLKNILDKTPLDKNKAHIIISTDKNTKEEDILAVKNILRKNGFYKVTIDNKLLPPPPPRVIIGKELLPPPPPPANATQKQLEKYKAAKEEYNRKKGVNIPPPPPPENKKKLIDSNGNMLVVGHRIPNSSISEKEVRHPSVLNYTDAAYKFVNLKTPNDLDFEKLKMLYNNILQTEKSSLMTPDYILNNKELLKKIMKDYKINK